MHVWPDRQKHGSTSALGWGVPAISDRRLPAFEGQPRHPGKVQTPSPFRILQLCSDAPLARSARSRAPRQRWAGRSALYAAVMPTWLTLPEAAKYLGVTLTTIEGFCEEGELRYEEEEATGELRVKREDLDALKPVSPVRARVLVRDLTRDEEERLLAAVQRAEPARGWKLRTNSPLHMVVERPPVMAAQAAGPPRAASERRIRDWVVDAATKAGIRLSPDAVTVSVEPTQ